MTEPADDLAPGTHFGPYQLLGELGKGGMGRVLKARHLTLQRDVALKVLAPALSAEPLFAERFLREARAAARLNHPNIVQVYDFGEVSGRHYLAMEFVDGRSLGALLRNWGPFSEEAATSIARQACSALAVAHEAGLVHRDVKPENLMLARKGVVKVVDLGLARLHGDDGSQTVSGMAAGTPHFMAPEQIEGRRDIDGRADVYALGATLFHLVTGRYPFPGPSAPVIMSRHLNEDVPDPRQFEPRLSEPFARAILRAMARNRDARTPDALAFDRDLAAAQLAARAGTANAAPSASPPPLPGATAVPAPRTVSPPSTTPVPTPVTGWDAAILKRFEEELVPLVGPMARILVQRAARTSADASDLRLRLADQIPGQEDRTRFLASGSPARSVSPAGSLRTASPAAPLSALATSPPSGAAASLAADDPRLAQAERILAAEVGPLARVLVRRAARSAPTWAPFVEAVSAEVPDPARRDAVRSALLGLPAPRRS